MTPATRSRISLGVGYGQPQPAGGNVTGITNLGSESEPKRLRDAHEVVPSAARFAVLVNPNNTITMKERIEAAQTGAQRLGLELVILKASTAAEIETAFVAAIEQRASALLASDAYFESQRDQLAGSALSITGVFGVARLRDGRRADELRCHQCRNPSAGRRLCGSHSQG